MICCIKTEYEHKNLNPDLCERSKICDNFQPFGQKKNLNFVMSSIDFRES